MGSAARLTEEKVKKVSGQFELESIFNLSMCRMGLHTIENLHGCTSLTHLDLSHNRIDRLRGLDALKQLKKLSLIDNEITRVEGLDGVNSLETLQLQGNQISQLDDVGSLSPLPALRVLSFRTILEDGTVDAKETNPVCNHPAYRTTIRRMLPKIKCIDGEWVELIDALGGDDADAPLVIPDVKPEPWFSKEELACIGNADYDVELPGMAGFEQALTDCKRISARAKTLLDDVNAIGLT